MKKKIIFDIQDDTSGLFLIPKEKILDEKSDFQKIEIFEHDLFGKVLSLDGSFQTSEYDEFLYHEPLVHFPLFAHNNPKKVLIIGGGDGGALKEVVKHKDIKEIFLVELDKKVVEISQKYLRQINNNSFEDGRVILIFDDGIKFLEGIKEKFDIVILDLTDPTGESTKLYTKEFYKKIKEVLNESGILSLHTESYLFYPKIFGRIISTLKEVFKYVSVYGNDVPLYGGTISFALCSDNVDFHNLTEETIDNRFQKKEIFNLRYFTPSLFIGSLKVPRYVEDIIKNKNEIITLKNQLKEGKRGSWEEK